MKPDKHKQKRSQQYKKKHGLSADKEENDKPKASMAKNRVDKPSDNPPKPTNIDGSRPSDNQEDGIETNTTRVLPSNWHRYEELPEDNDSLTSRGADFSILLQSSGSAITQLKLADEVALDEDISDQQADSYHLHIDPRDLVAAFDCIPLNKRLLIDERFFDKEHIQLFVEEARINRKLYDEKRNELKLKQDCLEQWLECNDDKLDSECDLKEITSFLPLGVKVAKSEIPQEILEDLDDILAGGMADGQKRSNAADRQPSGSDHSRSIKITNNDQPSPKTTTVKTSLTATDGKDQPSTQMMADVSTVTNIEDELDKLLTIDDEEEMSQETEVKTEIKSKKDESQELEDWLDSILDG